MLYETQRDARSVADMQTAAPRSRTCLAGRLAAQFQRAGKSRARIRVRVGRFGVYCVKPRLCVFMRFGG